MVTIAALLKLTRLDTFISLIFSRLSSGFSAFRSWKSPTAFSSTEHKAAACWICLKVNSSPSCRLGFFPAGGSFLTFGVAGNSSCEEKAEGLSEGRDDARARLEGCALSADCDLGRGIWYGRRCFLRKCSCWGESVSIGWGGCEGCSI